MFDNFFAIFLDPHNIDTSAQLLRQRSSKSFGENESEYFKITIDKLTSDLLLKFEDMILLILN